MKTLKASLKEPVFAWINHDLDFVDWLKDSAIVEDMKRDLLLKIRSEMHNKIATLCLDDLKFETLSAK